VQRKKVVDPKWILAGHYFAVVYHETAIRGFKPLNLQVTNGAEFMEHLARGTAPEWRRDDTKDPKEVRLSRAFLGLIWSHGRKHNADDRVDMERLAERFIEEHRLLFAEITLMPGVPA
jgi:hypothetical protein